MSESASESSKSSYSQSAGSDGGSSAASESRALNALNTAAGDDERDDMDNNNKSFQEGVFATIYTLTKNRTLDSSKRLAVLRILAEWLQLFRVLFNSTYPWQIQQDLWIFKAIKWMSLKLLVIPKGYATYIGVFYFLGSLMLATLAATAWVAVRLRGSESNNIWMNRLVKALQVFALVVYTILWPAILDFTLFLWNCQWTDFAHGGLVLHAFFPDKQCLAMPHMVNMLLAGVMSIVFAGATLLMSTGGCDLNPLSRNVLASPDALTSFKMLALKMAIVLVSACLDCIPKVQVAVALLALVGLCCLQPHFVPYYSDIVNMVWTGLWVGLFVLGALLASIVLAPEQLSANHHYQEQLTWMVLYLIFPAVLFGICACWLRLRLVKRLSASLYNTFLQHKAESNGAANGGAAVPFDLKKVHRWRDVEQVSLVLRSMRKWDEDGIPHREAAEFGEFVLKCGMARMPGNPTLLVMYANFLIEVRKDGQAARTQMQLAQKSNPSFLDEYNVYVVQQLAKEMKRDGDGLDLLGYVEFQRNYSHKMALMAQRQFWNSLLKDSITFKELQGKLQLMEQTEQKATTVYRRVLERYPSNGKVLKVYGRYLEFVRNDPWTASKFYDEALKQGTAESMLAMTAGQANSPEWIETVGPINEKTDGLIIINAQGLVLMVNAPALAMFGYDKGELEGKNISMLMPPPFSTQHNNFLQRYVDTGVPHIVNKKRAMVALHKDRSIFPIILCATKLSGMGSDMLFMGLVRRLPPADVDGKSIVRFWTTSGGVILCSDQYTANSFGLDAAALVGQSFCSLCTDVEAANRFVTEVNKTSLNHETSNESLKLRTQMMHSYLPPVDVELCIEFGGAVDNGCDCRTIIVQACVLSESAATLVLDHKARIMYATDKLSTMLGYPVKSLIKMELGSLLPQPYCQLYKPWLNADTKAATTPSSCKAGGVVHILAANGSKLPVTLKITASENMQTGRTTHVVQVAKASEDMRLDQRRLLLKLSHTGTILEVNSGAPKALFGFNPNDVVGRPLATIVDVFGLWQHQFGEDNSLLAMLASQAMGHKNGGSTAAGTSWRVGVHLPVPKDSDIAAHGACLASAAGHGSQDNGEAASSLLRTLQRTDRVRAARMAVELLAQDDLTLQQLMMDSTAADSTPVLQVSLFRADALRSVVELDYKLNIAHADEYAGLMFGVDHKLLLKKSFARIVGLPTTITFEDLLGTKGAAVTKKAAIKTGPSGSAGASVIGQIKHVTAIHLGDGKGLKLELQALSYVQCGKTRYIVCLSLETPSSTSLQSLKQLREGNNAAVSAVKAAFSDDGQQKASKSTAVDPVQAKDSSPNSRSSRSSRSSTVSGSQHGTARHHVEDEASSHAPVGRRRTEEWVRETSRLPDSPEDSPVQDGKHLSTRKHRLSGVADDQLWEEPTVHLSLETKSPPLGAMQKASKGKQFMYAEDAVNAEHVPNCISGVALSAAASASESDMDENASLGGSELGDGTSEAGAAGHNEELAIDARRAKRLKKVNRMVQSSTAQFAATSWRTHTLGLVGLVLVAHVVCFAVLVTQIDRRYSNAEAVSGIAHLLTASMQSVLRVNFMQKCWMPEFQDWWVCSETNMRNYKNKLLLNTGVTHEYHQMLYLGKGKSLKPFKDERLMDYWTYRPVGEKLVYPLTASGTMVPANGTRTLWMVGNSYVAACKELYFFADTWKASMVNTSTWRYIYDNGADSLYKGYAWSLDTFVDYTWRDLSTLSATIIALLVGEALVQLGCMVYELYLLQRCNLSHMRLFSVFLALPSATVRLMAQRQLQVDDDNKEELDDDEMELAGAAGVPADGGTKVADNKTAQPEKKQKSVRMAGGNDDNDGDYDACPTPNKAGGHAVQGRPLGKGKSPAPGKAAAPKRTGFALFRHAANKALSGWLNPKFKRNGKKLIPSSSVIWKFMVPLLLWLLSVVIIFAVSDRQLDGLQGPLASLDLVAHVLYRTARVRLAANELAFSLSAQDNARHRAELRTRLDLLRREYQTLLYGGRMLLAEGVQVSFDPVAPASVLDNADVADVFFKTTNCLRADKSTCYQPDSEFYTITHSGIDAMFNKFLDSMEVFMNLPDELATAEHPSYMYVAKVVATDQYDGLQGASELFVAWTISRLQAVKMLHIILLAISLFCMLLFLWLLYTPYIKLLHHDSKAAAGLLSQLPAEVDVEGQIKSTVLGYIKPASGGNASIAAVVPGLNMPMLPQNASMAPGMYASGMTFQGASAWAGMQGMRQSAA